MGVCRETERVCCRAKGKGIRGTWLQPKRSTASGTPSVSVVRYGIEHHSKIWTSTRCRAHHTAWPFETAGTSISTLSLLSSTSTTEPDSYTAPKEGASKFKVKVIEKPQMSEINPGVWDGLTPDQAKKFYPEEWARFVKDPYAFRAPRAESYHDLSGTPPSQTSPKDTSSYDTPFKCVWNQC